MLFWLGRVSQVSFRLREDLTSLAGAGEKEASPQVPRDHPLGMHAVGGQTLLTYSQSSTGQCQAAFALVHLKHLMVGGGAWVKLSGSDRV